MLGEKFVDQAKEQYLYEGESGGDIGLMLEQTATNSRVNEKMARWIISVTMVVSGWRGNYQNLFGDFGTDIQRLYLNMEGYSRKQAIELAGASRPTMGGGMVGEEKKAGLAGLLGK